MRRLDLLLRFNGREVLEDAGKVSKEVAEQFALSEFEKYRIIQERRLVSDYDLFVEGSFSEVPGLEGEKKKD